jgi:peptidoglycan hydrolase-like protein with peptidoglycan-binding domain
LHDNDVPLGAPVRDLADPTYARRSLRASLERRVRRARRRRVTGGGRRALVAAGCLLALGSAGAAAHQTGASKAARSSAQATTSAAGYDVRAVQRRLGVPADGIVGPQTRRAVKRFQQRNGLTVDGVIGPETLRALGLSATSSSARSSSERSAGRSRTASSQDRAGMSERLARIAECESGGDPTAVSPDGRYRGKYQFSRETWRSLGGKGDPAEASEAEQDLRAAALMERQGPSAWPVCSRRG